VHGVIAGLIAWANRRAMADAFSAGADSLPRVSDFSPQTSPSRVRTSERMAANV